MDRELNRKLQSEQPLSVEESLRLDEELDRSHVSSKVLGLLSDESPSMAWRSQLNARLSAEVAKSKKRLAFRWFSGVAATAAVAAFAVLVLPTMTSSPVATPGKSVVAHEGPSVEESLVSAHKEADLENAMGVTWTQVDFETVSGS